MLKIMKIKLTEKKEAYVYYLGVSAGVRYWEDASLNGVEDVDGKIPFRNGENWEPIINLETGIIKDWPLGIEADIHYKICDDGRYTLLDDKFDLVKFIDGYVPDIMCPEGSGYGDYIIMKVDGKGKINNFRANLDDFDSEED